MTTLDGLDQTAVSAYAWEELARTWYGQLSRGTSEEPLPSVNPLLTPADGCTPIKFTEQEFDYSGSQRHNGAIVVGFSLTASGEVQGQRILIELPTEAYGDELVDAMERWEADVTGVPQACLAAQTAVVTTTWY